MGSFLLPCVTTGLSLNTVWCLSGATPRGQPWTPAMAAGLTDHVWTLKEVLMFRVPPWRQPHAV